MDNKVTLIDFGLCCDIGHKPCSHVGTQGFVYPDKVITTSHDIYSWACIAIVLLTTQSHVCNPSTMEVHDNREDFDHFINTVLQDTTENEKKKKRFSNEDDEGKKWRKFLRRCTKNKHTERPSIEEVKDFAYAHA
jgi:serine/threonine protein kinase